MKILPVLLSFVLFLVGCAHEETRPVEITMNLQGIHVDVPNAIELTADDLHKLDKGIGTQKTYSLSKDRKAICKKAKCEIADNKPPNLTFTREEWKEFDDLRKRALLTKNEARQKKEYYTLRCTPANCAVDIHVHDDDPYEIKTTINAHIRHDYSSELFGAFLQGMVGGALGKTY
jgi:hypothetical protein